MKFDELDGRLRLFETAHDQWVLPGIHMDVPRGTGSNTISGWRLTDRPMAHSVKWAT